MVVVAAGCIGIAHTERGIVRACIAAQVNDIVLVYILGDSPACWSCHIGGDFLRNLCGRQLFIIRSVPPERVSGTCSGSDDSKAGGSGNYSAEDTSVTAALNTAYLIRCEVAVAVLNAALYLSVKAVSLLAICLRIILNYPFDSFIICILQDIYNISFVFHSISPLSKGS